MVVFNLTRDKTKFKIDKWSAVQSSRPGTIVKEATVLMICH